MLSTVVITVVITVLENSCLAALIKYPSTLQEQNTVDNLTTPGQSKDSTAVRSVVNRYQY